MARGARLRSGAGGEKQVLTMSERRRIPIGTLWSMRIDVPYSLMVREGGLAWSCGQVPLDAEGRVLDPGDIVAQSRRLCTYVRDILGRVGLSPGTVGKLVAYHLGGASEADAMVRTLREELGESPLIVPVAVPHFYYDGMMLEADLFASASKVSRKREIEREGVRVEAVEADGLVWASVAAEDGEGACGRIVAALEAAGLNRDRLLSDHWFMSRPGNLGRGLSEAGLASDAGAAVRTAVAKAPCMGELTFAAAAVEVTSREDEGLTIVTRRQGPFLWVSAREHGSADLVSQTHRIMAGIEAALLGLGLSFREVVKSTTHYVAGNSEEELHDNMEVRNARYDRPGPASTGIPVAGLGEAGSLTAVDVLALERA